MPTFQAILDQIKPLIDNKEEIPDNLMAPLLKGRLLQIKAVEKEKEAARIVTLNYLNYFVFLYDRQYFNLSRLEKEEKRKLL